MNKTKNVTFLMNQVIMGGLEKVLLQYIVELQKNGIKCVVISKTKVTDKYFLNFFKENGVKLADDIRPFADPHFFIKKLINKIWIKHNLKKHLSKTDCVVDFANFSFSKYLKSIHKPKIGWCHGSIMVFDRLAKKCDLKIYDKIICLTQACKNEVVKAYPVLKDKIEHIYNPIDLSDIKVLKTKSHRKPYFIAVQRLDGEKDVKTIIDAFNIFSNHNSEYELLIVGDGPLRAELTEYAKLNEHIIFTGQVDVPYQLISDSKALILSSTTEIGEGLGMVLLEAQALGVVAVSSDVPSGPREILLNGDAGLLFKPGNAEELARIMFDIANGSINTKTIITNAKKSLTRFDRQTNVNKLINLIEQMG